MQIEGHLGPTHVLDEVSRAEGERELAQIREELKDLLAIIDNKDADGMKGYLTKIRKNVDEN